MITVKFDEKCELPAMDEPSSVTWQAKRLTNTTTGEPIVNGMKRAFREYRVDSDMRVLEKKRVYDSIGDALYGSPEIENGEMEWVDTSLSFEMVMVGSTESYYYRYILVGSDGVVDSVELVEKNSV